MTGKTRKIVVPIMGPTGAGKSTFINSLIGQQRMTVGGETLKPQTSDLADALLDMRRYPGTFKDKYQIIVVDTPGFDGTADVMILKKIAEWVKKSYKHGGAILGGVIYLHDVSLDHLTDKAQRNLEIFQALCGQGALSKVILGTTKWGRISDRRAQAHEDELKRDHWKTLIAEGAKVRSFKDKNDAESAWKFIDIVVNNVSKNDFDIDAYFQFQEELGAATDADEAMRAIQKKVLDLRNQVAELEGTTADPERIKKAQEKLSEAEKTLNKLLRQDVESFAQWFRRIFQQVLVGLTSDGFKLFTGRD